MKPTQGNGQPETNNIRYCLYARKSSESDERQAMSLDSQIKEMRTLAQREELAIKEVRQESCSAKISGTRPVFNQILADIKEERFSGILTWAPDRLSRNAGDLGMLVDLMDQEKLLQIKTFSQTFTNNPNEKFLLMILCSQAKLENDQKGLNVKRGIRAKCEMGWRPGVAPLGYYNRAFNGVKDIVIDPERGPKIKEAFGRVAKYGHSGRRLKRRFDRIRFRTRTGKRFAVSQIYRMLKNPFYYGEFEYPLESGNWYKGAYKPLISKELFDKVQKQLKAPRLEKWGKKQFIFKGLLVCDGCSGKLVGEEKFKKLLSGELRRHVYYHCSRYYDHHCKEPYINERKLTNQLIHLIKDLDEKKLNISYNLKTKIKEYCRIQKQVIIQNDLLINEPKPDLKKYAEYVLREGSNRERRELIIGLNLNLYLKDRKVRIKK